MTRTVHDQFAKSYLSGLFAQAGTVEAGYTLSSEVKEIDILFRPDPNATVLLQGLGLLGRMASTFCLFEPYRNPVQAPEVEACLSRLLEVRLYLRRQSKRDRAPAQSLVLPCLWILSPTASPALLQRAGAHAHSVWGQGVYLLPAIVDTAIVVLHQLPTTLDTLWLRLLGRGRVQAHAIAELLALSSNHAFRKLTLEQLAKLQLIMKTRQKKLSKNEQELVDNLNPVYEAWEQLTIDKGRQEMLARTVPLLLQAGLSLDTIAHQLQIDVELVRQAAQHHQD